jgi:glycerol-3-phosphate dehydrogenase
MRSRSFFIGPRVTAQIQCTPSVPESMMHVLVLGGGVVGVASAWYLARAGF